MTTTDDYPKPPSMRWGLVVLFHMLTFGIFGVVWMFRQAAWVRRLDQTCNAMFFLVATFALIVMVIVVGEEPSMRVVRIPMQVLGTLTFWWAYILMRRSIEDKFSVSLGLFMTILFNFIYLQYHLRRIAKGEYHFRRGEEAKFSGR